MNPIVAIIGTLFTPLDLAKFATTLPAKIEKDELRMRLFGMATVKKTAEIAAAVAANAVTPASAFVTVSGQTVEATVDTVESFGQDLADVLAEYERDAEAMAPKKWSLAALFGHADPFVPARAQVRAFAAKWKLDPAFVSAMG